MGTTYSIKIVAPDSAADFEQLAAQVSEELDSINSRMSTWQVDSELSLLNSDESTDWIEVSAELCGIIESALAISQFTDGAFDITVGPLVNLWGFGPGNRIALTPPADDMVAATRPRVGYRHLRADCARPAVRKERPDLYIDLSGYAKGYAVDQLANLLNKNALTDYLVEIGGELRMRGHNATGDNWSIAVEKPDDLARTVQIVVRLSNQSMATSGDYRNFYIHDDKRFSHTIDSRTGRPVAHNGAAVTVVTQSAARADALATALLVLGPGAGFEFAERERIAAYFLLRDDAGISEKATTLFKALSES
jgi:thiamine biosynthesis lipoprotein